MAPGGEQVSPLNVPQVRRLPAPGPAGGRSPALPTYVDNDAKALALGEGWVGAAAGERDFIAMVVSTGVGGGIVLDGRLLDGAAGNAGHIGHVIVEPDGRRVRLRRPRAASRPRRRARRSGRITGRPPAEAGPELRRRTGTLVGRAVASVANLLDLRLAVVAGSVALGYGDDFFDGRPGRARRPGPARLLRRRPHRARPASAPTARSSGAAAVAWRALGVGSPIGSSVGASGYAAWSGGSGRWLRVARSAWRSGPRRGRWRRRRGTAAKAWPVGVDGSDRGPRSSRRPQVGQSQRNMG